jgi:hypothetical protein
MSYPQNNCCFGDIFQPRDPRLNDKKYKQKSSTETITRKILAVTKEQAENQTTKANNNCPSNLQITNTGGPGNKVEKQSNNKTFMMSGNVNGLRNKRRLIDTGKGIDKKHNSYDRYLARKKGWVLRNQLC